MKHLHLTVANKRYVLTLDEEFAPCFEAEIARLTSDQEHSISIKELLMAFMQKCYDEFSHNHTLHQLIQKCELSSDNP